MPLHRYIAPSITLLHPSPSSYSHTGFIPLCYSTVRIAPSIPLLHLLPYSFCSLTQVSPVRCSFPYATAVVRQRRPFPCSLYSPTPAIPIWDSFPYATARCRDSRTFPYSICSLAPVVPVRDSFPCTTAPWSVEPSIPLLPLLPYSIYSPTPAISIRDSFPCATARCQTAPSVPLLSLFPCSIQSRMKFLPSCHYKRLAGRHPLPCSFHSPTPSDSLLHSFSYSIYSRTGSLPL